MALSAKQEKFCEEYLVDLNATQAAIRSGYSKKTAAVIGAENLIKPNIASKIECMRSELSKETKVSAESIIKELAKGAFSEIPLEDMKFADKLKCLELLSKHLGLLDGSGAETQNTKPALERLSKALSNIGRGGGKG